MEWRSELDNNGIDDAILNLFTVATRDRTGYSAFCKFKGGGA